MDLSDGSKDLELAGSPRRSVPVFPFVQVNVVVVELQQRAHFPDVYLACDLHRLAPLGRFVRALIFELVQIQPELVFAARWDL